MIHMLFNQNRNFNWTYVYIPIKLSDIRENTYANFREKKLQCSYEIQFIVIQ